MARPTGRPTGRPPALDRIIRHDPDGTPITVSDVVIQALRDGHYIESAAAKADIHKTTIYEWMRTGARCQAALTAGEKHRRDLSRKERLCVDFAYAVDLAKEQGIANDWDGTGRVAAGQRRHIVTEKLVAAKDAQGQPQLNPDGSPRLVAVERTVRVEDAEPDGAMLRWRLEKKDPTRFGKSSRLEVTGLDGGPVQIEQTMDQKRARVLEFLDDLAPRLAVDPDAEIAAVLDVTEAPALPAGAQVDEPASG